MALYNVVLEEKRHQYQFLAEFAFDGNNGKFRTELIQQLIGEYLVRHIKKDVDKKGDIAKVMESLVKKIGESCSSGKDMFGTGSSLAAVLERLHCGEHVDLHIGLANVTLGIRRFGDCIGIQVHDSHGGVHNNGIEIFEAMASLYGTGSNNRVQKFIHSRSIIMPLPWVNGDTAINVVAELTCAARYVPDVEWDVGTDGVISGLFDDYITTNPQSDGGGVIVGRYHDIPIYIQLLFGEKNSDNVWRRGSITRDGVELLFNGSNGSLSVRYFVRIADENNMFKKAEPGINYAPEQWAHDHLARLLFNAFSARDMEGILLNNSHLVAWKEAVKSKSATS